MEAYVIERFPALPAVREYLLSRVEQYNTATKNFLFHTAASTLLKLHEDSPELQFSPIPDLRRHFGRVNWKGLKVDGLIETRSYQAHVRARRYKITQQVIDDLLEILALRTFEELRQATFVNLPNGKPLSRRRRNETHDRKHRNPHPRRFVNAVKEIERNGCYFNRQAVENVIQKRRGEVEALRWQSSLLFLILHCPSLQLTPTIRRLFLQRLIGHLSACRLATRRWQNDFHCYYSILIQRPTCVGNGIWWFRPAYRPAMSGRAQQIGGGFQSASRELKAAATAGMKDFHNYDLEASQPNALRLSFEQAGSDTAWLDQYLSTPDYKAVYAANLGVSPEGWKKIMMALMFGGSIPTKARRPKEGRGAKWNTAIELILWEESGHDLTRMSELINRFSRLVDPLVAEMKRWQAWLVGEHVPTNMQLNRNGQAFIRNATGMIFYLEELPRRMKERVGLLTAFVLQGIESSFIHYLTERGPTYGYKVIQNEHDGFWCIGTVPETAVEEARKATGFEYAKLVLKELLPHPIAA